MQAKLSNVTDQAMLYYRAYTRMKGEKKANTLVNAAQRWAKANSQDTVGLDAMIHGHNNVLRGIEKENKRNMNRGTLINNCYVRPRNGRFEYLEPTKWVGRHPSCFRVTEVINDKAHAVAMAKGNLKHVKPTHLQRMKKHVN